MGFLDPIDGGFGFGEERLYNANAKRTFGGLSENDVFGMAFPSMRRKKSYSGRLNGAMDDPGTWKTSSSWDAGPGIGSLVPFVTHRATTVQQSVSEDELESRPGGVKRLRAVSQPTTPALS